MYTFLNFLCNLMNIKNKNLQNQLYPLLLKPLLAIVSVQPINGYYLINIQSQINAARLLKDVIKFTNIEESNVVEVVIERVKLELKIIH